MKSSLLILALFLSAGGANASWNLNDVSILMPLPESQLERDLMIQPDDELGQGPLLPQWMFDRIGILSNSSEDGANTYRNLRAVSFRFDPCPTEMNRSKSCQPEFRIVWQPLVLNVVTGKWITEDDAIHTFYRLEPSQYEAFKQSLLALKNQMEKRGVTTHQKALGIHPALRNPATRREFRTAFKEAVLKNVGESNFYNVTFMKLLVANNWWKFFGGFERNKKNQWISARIPRHGGTEIDIINDATEVNPVTGQTDEMDSSIFTLYDYPTQDDLRYIISAAFRRTYRSDSPVSSDLKQFKERMGATLRFQNPKLTNPKILDCAHCHLADAAQTFAVKVFPELRDSLRTLPDRYLNPDPAHYNTGNSTIALTSTKAVHAFGYFIDSPSIMTRVIHDSIESAEQLNRH